MNETSMNIAEVLAANLMTNGSRNKATRLVLVDDDGNDIGGLCYEAIRDSIAAELSPIVSTAEECAKRLERHDSSRAAVARFREAVKLVTQFSESER